MRIGELTKLDAALAALAGGGHAGWYLSTAADALPVDEAAARATGGARITAFIGPEGGWTDDELSRFAAAALTPVRLTSTVLRVETAAIVTAAMIGSLVSPRRGRHDPADPAV